MADVLSVALTQRIDRLFEEWENKNVFRDGLLDEKLYVESNPKVMWLLKDPNTKEKRGDLLEIIKAFISDYMAEEDNLPETLRRAAIFSYLIQEGLPEYVSGLASMTDKKLIHGLSSSAIVNLKKTQGGRTADLDAVYEEAERSFDLWTKQMSILKPDIILCGGTYKIVSYLYRDKEVVPDKALRETPNGLPYLKHDDSVYIDFFHPLARIRQAAEYAYLKEGLKQIMEATIVQ